MATERRMLKANPAKAIKIGVNMSDFTDGGGVAGTYTANLKKLLAGSKVIGCKTISTGLIGDVSAGVLIGKGGATDDFGGASQNMFAAGTFYGAPATIAEEGPLTTDTAILITVTGATDFTLIANAKGSLYIEVYYTDLNSKAI